MKIVIFFLVIVAAASFATVYLADEPGYIYIQWGDWQIESTLMVVFIGTIFLLLAAYLIFVVVTGIGRLPFKLSKKLGEFHKKKVQHTSAMGYTHLIMGNWRKAEKQLENTAKYMPEPVINHLGAAYAAHKGEDSARCEVHMRNAANSSSDFQNGIALTRCRILIDAGKVDEAVKQLNILRSKVPDSATVQKLLVEVHEMRSDWKSIHSLIPLLRKSNSIPKGKIEALQSQAGKSMLENASSSTDLLKIWKMLSAGEQRNPQAISAYVNKLLEYDCHQEAEKIIRLSLWRNWDSDLAYLYGKVGGAMDRKSLYRTTESWLKDYPKDPGLLLASAIHARKSAQTAKAKELLEQCLQLGGRQEAYTQLGFVLEVLGETEEALKAYRKGADDPSNLKKEPPPAPESQGESDKQEDTK